MSIHLNADRFFGELGSLLRRIGPELTAASRLETESAAAILMRYMPVSGSALTQTPGPPSATQGAAQASKTPDLSDTEALLALLRADQSERARAADRGRQNKRKFAQPGPAQFAAPTEAELTACLRHQYPNEPDIRAANVEPMLGGNAKQTILFDAISGCAPPMALVMRRDVPSSFNPTTVIDEFPVIAALYSQGFPVPEPLWADGSNVILPTPYLITRKVSGSLAGDARGARREAGFEPSRVMANALARLHLIDPTSVDGWSSATWGEEDAIASLDRWQTYAAASMEERVPAVDIAFAWLRSNVRESLQAPAIVHGEAGFHNILIENGQLTAVIDWEMAHIGSPVEDLCYVKGQIEQHGRFDDFIELYVEAGGQPPSPSSIKYYDVYRLTRNILLFGAAVTSFNRGDTNKLPLLYGGAILFDSYVKGLSTLLMDIIQEDRSTNEWDAT